MLAAQRYASDVVEGKKAACRWVKHACERQIRDLERFRSRDDKYYFDPHAADYVCTVVEHFPHIKGEWARKYSLITLEPWQCFILSTVFGWKRRETNTRRFHNVYIEIPRKNAKSTMTSCVGLYLVGCDDEQGAQVVTAATTREQARLVFDDAQAMAKRERGYRETFGMEVHANAISQASTSSSFYPICAQDMNLDGLNLHGALVDELHAHRTRGLWDVLETAMGSRLQALMWAITTAGVNRASVCYEQHMYAKKVLQQALYDESYFAIIYTIDEDDDPFDEASWWKSNPNFGISIYPENMRATAAQARSIPSKQNTYFTKHLNIWVNADESWLGASGMRAWMHAANPNLEPSDFSGSPCYIAIDYAQRNDIAATILLFPPTPAVEKWTVFGRYYLPEDVVERGDNSQYQGWEATGLLTATPGPITDLDVMLDDLAVMGSQYDVQELALDPWRTSAVFSELEKRGVTVPVVKIQQQIKVMSPAMKELEAMILDNKFQHTGDPILTWMLSNVVCHRDAKDNIYPRKESSANKIDGVLGVLMCIDRAMKQQAMPDYENRGLWSI